MLLLAARGLGRRLRMFIGHDRDDNEHNDDDDFEGDAGNTVSVFLKLLMPDANVEDAMANGGESERRR